MAELLRVEIPGTPRPQGALRTSVRGGKAYGRYPDHINEHRAIVTALLHQAWQGREPLRRSVYLRCVFAFERPKSHYGTGRNDGLVKPSAPIFHTQIPDVDKLLRLVGDALKASGVIADDSQITAVYGQKSWNGRALTLVYLHDWDSDLEAGA